MGRSMTVSWLHPVLNTTEPEGLWQSEDCDEDCYIVTTIRLAYSEDAWTCNKYTAMVWDDEDGKT